MRDYIAAGQLLPAAKNAIIL